MKVFLHRLQNPPQVLNTHLQLLILSHRAERVQSRRSRIIFPRSPALQNAVAFSGILQCRLSQKQESKIFMLMPLFYVNRILW
ncbi:MAG: hypothetical protein ACI4NN_00360 [Pyramidobacter sp.]